MFLCTDCHKNEKCSQLHFMTSHGPCEYCKYVASCVDCTAYKYRKQEPETEEDKNSV